ncbi:MAG: 4-hydroxy-3-methylbut-2-enyl diphosphate reductase [Candidatus Omnitrophota bacterium]|nr:MAG: 4-hydroxy-3-methylbut-2-enyl diphosphate reductase [Candidatus Omnitrophota bacterium]
MNKAKIIISSNSGFCFGVKRALGIARRVLRKHGTIYSFGPIIHNPQVVNGFSGKGLKIIKTLKEIKSKKRYLLIPSHGISPDALRGKNISRIDTTCPFVSRVQKIVKDLREKGYFIIIVGDRKHPEVKGLVGMAGKNSCCVLADKKEAKRFNLKPKKAALISQTTATLANFKEILSEIGKKNFMELISFNTVCKNTIDRQKEAASIAEKVDAMIIIGGKNSANTSKLARTCKMVNKNTYHIESGRDLKLKFLKDKKNIGIATGASTPPYAIDEVVNEIRRFDN